MQERDLEDRDRGTIFSSLTSSSGQLNNVLNAIFKRVKSGHKILKKQIQIIFPHFIRVQAYDVRHCELSPLSACGMP